MWALSLHFSSFLPSFSEYSRCCFKLLLTIFLITLGLICLYWWWCSLFVAGILSQKHGLYICQETDLDFTELLPWKTWSVFDCQFPLAILRLLVNYKIMVHTMFIVLWNWLIATFWVIWLFLIVEVIWAIKQDNMFLIN